MDTRPRIDKVWLLLACTHSAGEVQGFYVFAGDCLSDGSGHGKPINTSHRSNMNSTIWKEFDLGEQLDAMAGPYLGSVDVTVRIAFFLSSFLTMHNYGWR